MYKKVNFAPSKTPAPKVDQIKGSVINPIGSAKSSSSASKISLNKSTLSTLNQKLKDFKEKHPNNTNVSQNDLKAVYRRGSGAYSSTHRPTINGGTPNSRAAWSYARVNKFLQKAGGEKVKKSYVQDDDLLENGGELKDIWYHKYDGEIEYQTDSINKYGDGIYFSNQKNSRFEGEQELACFITYKNPIVFEGNGLPNIGFHKARGKKSINEFCNELFEKHDAIIIKHGGSFGDELILRDKKLIEPITEFKMEQEMDKGGFYKNGGNTKKIDTKSSTQSSENDYGFTTPTGEKTRLTYLQQVLVRTKGFKDFFGDWEKAAKAFIADNRENFDSHYKNVSKIIDYVTLEPKVVFHGTRTEEEFFRFDVTKEKGVGRPYGYFAFNKEYSERFTQSSQRNTRESNPFLYSCFLNVRNPFRANAHDYWQKNRNADGWLECIAGTICWDKYKTVEKNSITKDLFKAIESQIKKYLEERFPVNAPFWYAMSGDIEKDFKYFLMAYGYDGINYGEEISLGYDPDDPSQYTEAVTIFDSKQVKLADGRNLNFNPLIDDIRYKRGGEVEENKNKVEEQYQYENDAPMNKKAKLGMLIGGNKYAEGGKIVHEGGSTNDGKKGGYFDGRSHAEGGIKAINVDTGQLLEVEGQEVIITKGAVNDETKREFEGEMLTNREILSRINQSGGGVSFEDGGKVGGHVCGCSGKKYKFGGEMLEDFDIFRNMSKPSKFVIDMLDAPKEFADFLVQKMK